MTKLLPLMEYNNQINEPIHKIVTLKNSKIHVSHLTFHFLIISFNSRPKCISDKSCRIIWWNHFLYQQVKWIQL